MTSTSQLRRDDYDRSVDRWALWFRIYDRLPRPVRRLVPARYK